MKNSFGMLQLKEFSWKNKLLVSLLLDGLIMNIVGASMLSDILQRSTVAAVLLFGV